MVADPRSQRQRQQQQALRSGDQAQQQVPVVRRYMRHPDQAARIAHGEGRPRRQRTEGEQQAEQPAPGRTAGHTGHRMPADAGHPGHAQQQRQRQPAQRHRTPFQAADHGHRYRHQADHQRGHGDAAGLHRAGQQQVVHGVAGQGQPGQVPPLVPGNAGKQRAPVRRHQHRGDQAVAQVATDGHLQRAELAHQFRGQEHQAPQRACADAAGNPGKGPGPGLRRVRPCAHGCAHNGIRVLITCSRYSSNSSWVIFGWCGRNCRKPT